ncbi:hypothetical protein Tsubulata_022373 [Turnera subulata]|uniref:Sec39 domain-containing protein n=1 Tax=Turnera subulata TaxID=218843 RepID=A0A9Q0G3E3_9ROSI|nr:hypothetical protein Tsubulata_022373 [Turnera subulata]
MKEGSVTEVLCETRRHATGRFTPNYPPQPSTKINEGGFLSRFAARGLSQLKEKWSGSPAKMKKPISLFISHRGERVAVASANQITILHKEDDYQMPRGVFTSGNPGTFTCGVWSESHDVLGVIDDSDTLYFIKANGEEIRRIGKRQLKISLPIVGVIGNNDLQGSYLCSFSFLTSDGSLHHIEISQELSDCISSMQMSNNSSILKRQFPKEIFCFDYHPGHALLVVVGSAVGINSTISRGNGGCYLSFWQRQGDLDLQPVSSIQFEGLYLKPKDFVGPLAYPKVLVSPEGMFVATLDIVGCLYVFQLDKESCSRLSFVGDGRVASETSNSNLPSGQIEALSDIVDFTWWSDHVIVVSKRNGIVIMLDVHSGLKIKENNPMYSVPVLERVYQMQGQLFLIECKPTEEGNLVPNQGRQLGDLQHVERIAESISNQSDFSRLVWSLVSISQRSVSEMYRILISNHKYEAALDFADRHSLDRDEVLKSQWLYSERGISDISLFLSKIKDHAFVLSECVDKSASTEDAEKALLAYGLRVTDQFRFSELEDYAGNNIWDMRMTRLQLLQFRDRLETYLGINMGRFSMQEYIKFRVLPLNEAAVTLAESGKIGALNLLFKRHPYSLSASVLQILAAIPETIPVQTYGQLLPGRSPPTSVALREEDWVECEEMVTFINKLPVNNEVGVQIRTEPIVKRSRGYLWPSSNELSAWYKNRARDIDCYSGQLDNCLCLVDFACRKNIFELQQFREDISFLHQLIYSDDSDGEICFSMSVVAWEQLSDYEKFRTILKEVNEENVVKKLHDKAIPFMKNRSANLDGHKDETFLVRWLKEIALENKLEMCLLVIEEGCMELRINGFFKNEIEAIDCALQCIYLCTVMDKWSTMAAILSKLPQKQDAEIWLDGLEKRIKLAEAHVEAGRLLALYQVPKPLNFFLEAHADEKSVKQILRLILSKFVRRQPGRSDNDWANMWRDMQCLREKAFPFLDPEYMLMEFCRGLLKAGKFSLARNYLKGTSSVGLASDKAENLVIQAAREYFFSASSLSCSEIWKAKECLSLFPNSRNVTAEIDIIDALTVKLPNLGVTLLPMQFRQIKDPMDIIKMAITSQAGAYLHVEELIEVAKLLGLRSSEEISAVEESIAREAAVAVDLQLAFDLCLSLAKKGHGPIWDLCAAIARGPALDNMDISSRKQLLGFALSHCDQESISELLHAWKDLDMQGQCETLSTLTGENSPNFSAEGSLTAALSANGIQDMEGLKNCSDLVGGLSGIDQEACFSDIKNTVSSVAKSLPVVNGADLQSLLAEDGKIMSFAAVQLPWLLELTKKTENGRTFFSDRIPGKHYASVQTQAMITILSWLARNGIAPRDDLIASMAKSIIEPPVTEEEDIIGCSLLLNLVDAFSGVEVIEEQLRIRDNYQEICSIMNVGLTYSLLHNYGVECNDPDQRRELLLSNFKEKHSPLHSDGMSKIDEVQSTFWKDWKLKLEEKKRVAEHSRVLEQIIPGVETTRFLSGDDDYIMSAVFPLIESVKSEKKHIIKDVLKLADIYGLNRTEVLLRYICSILVSEVWTDEEIKAEISQLKGEIIDYDSETIKTLCFVVYPAINGVNKQRLALIYSLLSDCYLHLEATKKPLPMAHPNSLSLSALELARLYKVMEQECLRVSFIKKLDFKYVAELDGLNLQSFSREVYANIDEFSVEALAKMVETLVSIYHGSVPKGLISWQDVYKHYLLSLLATLESSGTTELIMVNPEKFQEYVNQLEQTFDCCRMYIRLLVPSDALDVMKRYFLLTISPHSSSGGIPDNSTWQECLIIVLNFWLRVAEEMQEITSGEDLLGEYKFDPECLSSCLKIFMKLVMEDNVSPSQGWATLVGYVGYGLVGDFTFEIQMFCRAMVLSSCGFGATSEVFSGSKTQFAIRSAPSTDCESLDLAHLYMNMLEPLLKDLVDGSHEHHHLHHLLSSLSKLEGQIEDLQRVRRVVWERITQFSNDLQVPSRARVYALELMQFITGRNIKGFSADLEANVLAWEGWDELLSTSRSSEITSGHGLPDHGDSPSRFTSTLVALKSSQLVTGISPDLEITPDDLLNVETAVSSFLKLLESSSTDPHFNACLAVLEEWEGYFATKRDEVDSAEPSETANDWSNDDWNEGWESFQDEESLEKEKPKSSCSVHPLHVCWKEIFVRLVSRSRCSDVLRLIDRSLSKSNGALLDEDDARSLSQTVLEMDCFLAFKIMLLLPYDAVQMLCLDVVEEKLKLGGISDTIGRDHEFLMLVLSSGVISTIITKPSYGSTFSYICFLVGNLSRRYQEAQFSKRTRRAGKETEFAYEDLSLFSRILFPGFISELVKADQQILAGFVVTKYMHTNPSLSLINITEATLSKFLERQLHAIQHGGSSLGESSSPQVFMNTVSRLTDKLGTLVQSALTLVSSKSR